MGFASETYHDVQPRPQYADLDDEGSLVWQMVMKNQSERYLWPGLLPLPLPLTGLEGRPKSPDVSF